MELGSVSISFIGWGWLVLAFLASILFEIWPHLRFGYWQWRLDRRLARDAYMLREELLEYELAQGEEPEPLSWRRVLLRSLRGTLELGLPVLITDLVTDSDFMVLLVVAVLLPALMQSRAARGRDARRDMDTPAAIYPHEAKLGFLVGLACIIVVSVYAYSALP